MNKQKIWLITAAALTTVGILIFIGVLALNKWNFKFRSKNEFTENTYEITEAFSDINISITAADIELLPSADGKVTVVCREKPKLLHTARVENGTLIIEENDQRKWYEHIELSLSAKNTKITLYLPQNEYGALFIDATTADLKISESLAFGDVDIKITTGDIELKSITADSLHVKTTTGDIEAHNLTVKGDVFAKTGSGDTEISNLRCKNLTTGGTTGDTELENVIAEETLRLSHTTGDFRLEASDADKIYIKATTGDIAATLQSGKSFSVKTTTGKVSLPTNPDHLSGGICELKTTTGDIKIEVK